MLRLSGIAFAHVPNESDVPPQYRAKLARMGLAPGIPDLLIFTPPPCGGYVAAALEIKAPRMIASDRQMAWLERLRGLGWATAVGVGYGGCVAQLRAWGYVLRETPLG